MHALELKIPPVILLMLAIIGVYLCPVILPFISSYQNFPELRATIAWAILAVGVAIALAGILTFKRAKTTTNPVSIENTSSLVTHGIYRFTRNPMYLGMLMIIISFIIRTGYFSGLVFAMLFVVYMTIFQIIPEQRMLTKIFGAPFLDYMKRTRSWL